MFFPYLTYGLLRDLYRNNRRSANPIGLADPYKEFKDRVARRFGYQPIPTTDSGTNTVPAPSPTPAPVAAPVAAPVTTPVPSSAPANPSLPDSALTSEGGKSVDFQVPSIDIPEFNTTPKPAPATQVTQNPFYTTAPAPVTTPAPSQAPTAAPSTSASQAEQFTQN